MNGNDILAHVTKVIHDVLDDESIAISLTTTAKDVPEWDSLAHVQLVRAVEKHFKIRFTTQEINDFTNVGDMCRAIEKRLQV
jgi:acyl carrier protein